MTVRFRLLGPIQATVDEQPIPVGHAQLRCMLAVLLVEANQPVSVDQLIDRIWADRRLPRRPRHAVQHNIPLLRAILAAAPGVTLTRAGAGYQLSVDPDAVDVHRFHALLDQARAAQDQPGNSHTDANPGNGNHIDERVGELLTRALALWHGEPFADLTTDTAWLHTQRAALTAHRHAARLDLTDIRLRQGRHAALLAELAEHTAQYPLDERLAGQYLLALYRSSRPAEALAHYRQLQHQLAEELGTDPSPPLRELHQRILAAEPALTIPTSAAADAVSVASTVPMASVASTVGPAAPVTASVRAPVPRQLPAAPRLFTGRDTELAQLDKTLDDPADTGGPLSIIAIGGTGGIGKTWLALHWANQHLDRFPDGQLHVNLRGFDPTAAPLDPTAAVRGFLAALGVAPAAIPAEPDAQVGLYRSLLVGRRTLILADNARDTGQVIPLLPGSPSCTVLVTSRHHLGGLVTAHGAQPLDLDVLTEAEARQLLTRQLGHDRVAAEPRAVADLLACCAGLPLALGIVAARAIRHPHFPLADLAAELRDQSRRLDALNPGEALVTPRAVLSWSTRALPTPVVAAFGLLSLAAGPDLGLPAAASLLARPEAATQTLLRELADASLVQQHAPGRYRMHDLVRLYATDRAETDHRPADRTAAHRRVLDFYTHTAHTADRQLNPHREPIALDPPAPGVRPQPLADVPAALAWLDTEHAALLAAQQTAADRTWHRTVWQLAWALNAYQARRGHRHDRLASWQAALDAAGHLPDPAASSHAHRFLGQAHADLGQFTEGIEHLGRALALAEQQHDPDQQARTHRVLSWAWGQQGDDQRAQDHAAQARDLYHALGQPVWEAHALNAVGWYTARLGDYPAADAHCRSALTLHRAHDNAEGEAEALDSLGYIAHRTGRHRQAVEHYQQALTRFRALGSTFQSADTLDNLGHPHLALGHRAQAHQVWREALRLYQQQGRDADATRLRHQLTDLADHTPRSTVGTPRRERVE